MVGCANFVVVVADSSKIGREEFVSFAAIDRVDVLVTDSEIDGGDQGRHRRRSGSHRRGRTHMIVTVTPNPDIDRTVALPGELVRGAVHRATAVSSEPGGKGVNVARALTSPVSTPSLCSRPVRPIHSWPPCARNG